MGEPIYIKVEKEIEAPLSKVWEQVALGFVNVCLYNPEIKDSKFDSPQRQGIGTLRHCQPVGGGFLREQITEWAENKSFKLKLIDSSFPMAMIESRFSFMDNGANTKVVQEFWYRMKAPIGWLSILMKGKMKKTLENGLQGLAYYLSNNKKLEHGGK